MDKCVTEDSDTVYLRSREGKTVLPMYLYEIDEDNKKHLKEFESYENPTVQ